MIKVLRLDTKFINKLEELEDLSNIDCINYKGLFISTYSKSWGEGYEQEHYLNVYTKKVDELIYYEHILENLAGNFFYILYNEEQDTFLIFTKQNFQVIKDSIKYEFIKIKDLEY